MKTYNISKNIKAIIFDVDSTLYTNPEYAFEQVDCQIRAFAKMKGIPADEARKTLAEFGKKWQEDHNGQKISLGNALVFFDVPIEQSVKWRRELLEPVDYLTRDEKLINTIKKLEEKYKIVCVTNNPVLPARKTLEAIGISELIPHIVGLDTCLKSKPALEPFEKALEILECKACECVAIGDRYDMDIALPLQMGMGGVLVSGVQEVYELDTVLN